MLAVAGAEHETAHRIVVDASGGPAVLMESEPVHPVHLAARLSDAARLVRVRRPRLRRPPLAQQASTPPVAAHTVLVVVLEPGAAPAALPRVDGLAVVAVSSSRDALDACACEVAS